MAYGIVHLFKGGTKEQYEATLAKVHPNAGADLPLGQTVHIAGLTDDGDWIVVAIHDSQESWERVRDGALQPGLQEAGNEGLAGPPTKRHSRSTSTKRHRVRGDLAAGDQVRGARLRL
jgi:hypothetical protein